MNCREFADFLMDYLDETLPPVQRATFEEHMDACPQCITYLDTYRETVRLGKALLCGERDPVPEDVPEDLVAAILAARRVS